MSTSADDTALSPAEDVQALYDESAEWYAEIMDAEIGLPLYADTLGRLAERIRSLPGPVLDTSCGPGHMLRLYHDKFDGERALVGMDLSPKMVSMARKALAGCGESDWIGRNASDGRRAEPGEGSPYPVGTGFASRR